MFEEMTKDSKKLLSALYKEYLSKRKSGKSKSDASIFGSSEHIQAELMPEESADDVDETCRELDRLGYLKCFYADDIAYVVTLTTKAIADMENRFKNGLVDVVQFLQGFI